MNGLDIAILIIGAVVGFLGWRIGIIRVVVTLVGVVGGIYLAGRLYPTVGTMFQTWIEGENLARVAAFVAVFGGVFIAAAIVASIIKRILGMLLLGWIDNVAGMVLGLAFGLGALAALLAVLRSFPVGNFDQTIQDSALATFLLDRYRILIALLPRDISGIRPPPLS